MSNEDNRPLLSDVDPVQYWAARASSFTVLYFVPSGWWTAGTFATHAEAVASAAIGEAHTGWVHRVVVP